MKKALYLPFLTLLFLLACNSDGNPINPIPDPDAKLPVNGSFYKLPENLQEYYKEVNFSLKGDSLYQDLAVTTIAKHSTFLEYYQRHEYLYKADEDPNKSANVLLFYSGESRDKREYESGNNAHQPQTFNTEHVYPRSYLENEAEADLHVLRVADIDVNTLRSNYPFIQGEGRYKLKGEAFFPGDEWKGDVARIIMYMNLRYDEPFNDMGGLEQFLEWNAQDPVSTIEAQHNNIVEQAQGNRNPFIDNPHLATRIWGGQEAENRWDREDATDDDLIISEYIEGKLGFNKALEVGNPTDEAVNLSVYSLKKISNANTEWDNEYKLTGALAAGEVLVLVHEKADVPGLLDIADIKLGDQIINFNGNDPIGLFKNDILIDMLGTTGGADFAKDLNLRRKTTITKPNPNFTPEEWETFAHDNIEGLGTL